jgi:cobalt-zinc-cadmium efflux system protein
VNRLVTPDNVRAGLMLGVALAGIVVNLVATWSLAGANRGSMNVEGSFQHLLTDLFAFIGTAIAAGVILATGYDRADPIASLFVAALMLRSAAGLLRASGRVFMEAAPPGLDPEVIGRALAAHPGIVQVHDLHVWEVTSGFPALSAHVVVEPEVDYRQMRLDLERLIHDRFHIDHTTLQMEHRDTKLLHIELPQD